MSKKIQKLQSKYPQISEEITFFAQNDPSGKLKYIKYEVDILLSKQALQQEISDVINLFHKFQESLPKKDVYSYSNFTELREVVFELKQKQEDRNNKVDKLYQIDQGKVEVGADIVYEDAKYIIRHIKNKEAAVYYGLGTKWCISQKEFNYFNDYSNNNSIFFFIFDKTLSEDDPCYKIAQVFNRDSNNNISWICYFNALDIQFANQAVPPISNTFIWPDIIDAEVCQNAFKIAGTIPEIKTSKIKHNRATEEEVISIIDLWKEDVKLDRFLVCSNIFIKILENSEELMGFALERNVKEWSRVLKNIPETLQKTLEDKIKNSIEHDFLSLCEFKYAIISEDIIKFISDQWSGLKDLRVKILGLYLLKDISIKSNKIKEGFDFENKIEELKGVKPEIKNVQNWPSELSWDPIAKFPLVKLIKQIMYDLQNYGAIHL